MTNLDLAGGGAMLAVAGGAWVVWGFLEGNITYEFIGAWLGTVGLLITGLAPNDNMALGPEDLDE